MTSSHPIEASGLVKRYGEKVALGGVDLVVSNPPYIGTDEPVARSVVDWEPADALFAGPGGLAAAAHHLGTALKV